MAKGSLLPFIMAVTSKGGGRGGKDRDETESDAPSASESRDTGEDGGDHEYSMDHSHVKELLMHGKTKIHHESGRTASLGCDYSKADKHFDAGMKGFKDAYEKSKGGGETDGGEEEEGEYDKPAMSGGREVSY